MISKWREDFSLSRDATTHPRGNLARLVLILGDILGSELLEIVVIRSADENFSVSDHAHPPPRRYGHPRIQQKLTSSGRTCSASHWFLAR